MLNYATRVSKRTGRNGGGRNPEKEELKFHKRVSGIYSDARLSGGGFNAGPCSRDSANYATKVVVSLMLAACDRELLGELFTRQKRSLSVRARGTVEKDRVGAETVGKQSGRSKTP